MPQKTVFIRDRDLEKWNQIEKKSEFIHNALNSTLNIPQKELDKLSVGSVVSDKPVKDWSGPIFRDKKKSKL